MEQFANAPQSYLANTISSSATSLTVLGGAAFSTTGTFRLAIDAEFLIVTAVSGNTFTVSRGAEGSAATPHFAGAVVAQVLTGGALRQFALDLQSSIPGVIGSPGATITNAGYSVQITDTWKEFDSTSGVPPILFPGPAAEANAPVGLVRRYSHIAGQGNGQQLASFSGNGAAITRLDGVLGVIDGTGNPPWTTYAVTPGITYSFAFDGSVYRCLNG